MGAAQHCVASQFQSSSAALPLVGAAQRCVAPQVKSSSAALPLAGAAQHCVTTLSKSGSAALPLAGAAQHCVAPRSGAEGDADSSPLCSASGQSVGSSPEVHTGSAQAGTLGALASGRPIQRLGQILASPLPSRSPSSAGGTMTELVKQPNRQSRRLQWLVA